jgi:hypothetical protein
VARIRSVKPEFWDDRKLARRTSRDARLLYIALWNLADEHGRLNGDPQWIKGQAFSYDDDLDAGAVAKLLEELCAPAVGAVIAYEDDGDPYLFLPKLARHQRLEPEKVKSRLPAPPSPGADSPEPGADSSGRRADESERGADSSGSGAKTPALLYGAGSREHVAGSRDARGAQTAVANSLLDEHLACVSPRPPREVIRQLGEKIESLLADGMADTEIAEALKRLRAKPKLTPATLPSLVHEVRQERANPKLRPTGRASPHQAYRNPPDQDVYAEELRPDDHSR